MTTTGSLSTASFTVNVSGSMRFSLRDLDGASNRVDLDDIAITDYSGAAVAAETPKVF